MSSNLKLKDCFTSETLANANIEITENEAEGKIHILWDFESRKDDNFDFKLDMLRKATFFHLFLILLNPDNKLGSIFIVIQNLIEKIYVMKTNLESLENFFRL